MATDEETKEWADQHLHPEATEYVKIELPEAKVVYGGWRVGETELFWVEIWPMLFNHRIALVDKSDPMSVGRYWCYSDLTSAVLAATVWEKTDDTEPVGWKKSWDQRYDGALL